MFCFRMCGRCGVWAWLGRLWERREGKIEIERERERERARVGERDKEREREKRTKGK